jgi:6-phosphofructokinase 2
MVDTKPGMARPIITLTMNPALDLSTATDQVIGEHKMRCGPTRVDPGGGGVNVARVIHRLGGQAVAIYAVGGPTGDAYRQLLEREGVPTRPVRIAGTTRQSFTVDERTTGKQFRFVLEGPDVSEPEWQDCLAALDQATPHGGYVVASGSLPPGVPLDFYARVARLCRERGAHCIVDAAGPALAEALAEGVFMIKPSRRELGELVGGTLSGEHSLIAAALEIITRGSAKYVALTLGGEGAVLASSSGVLRQRTPVVQVQSTVGAGDSFLGAFVLRLGQGNDVASAFRSAVAAGSAAAMSPATELCSRVDVERLEVELLAG